MHFLVKKDSPHFKMTSKDFFDQLKLIVKERYEFQIEDECAIDHLICLRTTQNKVSFLRELCLQFGVQLKPRKYCFEQTIENFEMPISLNDVTGTFPHTKSA